jgi:hypothetical protein
MEHAVQLIDFNPRPCRNCGGKLELKAIIARFGEVPESRYCHCRNCDRIDVIECRSADAAG